MTLPDDFVFSQSSLQDYVDCPRRFELKYILRQRWPAPEVDDLLEFERRMEQGQRFHQLLHQLLIGLPADVLTRRIQDNDVRRWFQMVLESGLEDVPEIRYPEQMLTVPLGAYALLAKFDLVAIGEKALIIDWKTARKVPKADWLAKRLQTIVYRFVLATGGARFNQGQPIAPDRIEMLYWYTDSGTTRRFTYGASQFKTDEIYLLGLIDEINSRKTFPLTEDTRHCRFCVYRSLCDRGTSAGSLDEWDNAEDMAADFDDFAIDIDQIAEIEF